MREYGGTPSLNQLPLHICHKEERNEERVEVREVEEEILCKREHRYQLHVVVSQEDTILDRVWPTKIEF
jgi:hypothetical protein